jgi:hypothetical protein
MRYTYTTEYYSAIKKNKTMSFVPKWMEMEIIMLTEISQTERDKKMLVLSHTQKPDLKEKIYFFAQRAILMDSSSFLIFAQLMGAPFSSTPAPPEIKCHL